MTGNGWMAVLGLGAALACGRELEDATDLDAVAAAVERSGACAEELARAAEDDPDGVARALAAEPARLAPFARSARAVPVREVIAERLDDARAGVAVARALCRLPAEDRAWPTVAESARRSLRGARAMCASAERVRAERLAAAR
jgi:hypothetical protein